MGDPPVPDGDEVRARRRPRPLAWLSARLPEARTERGLVIATLAAVFIVGGSTLAIVRSSPNVARAAVDAPTLLRNSTTTTLAPTATTAPATLAPRTAPVDPLANPQAVVPL